MALLNVLPPHAGETARGHSHRRLRNSVQGLARVTLRKALPRGASSPPARRHPSQLAAPSLSRCPMANVSLEWVQVVLTLCRYAKQIDKPTPSKFSGPAAARHWRPGGG
jgi:hypothetical protein